MPEESVRKKSTRSTTRAPKKRAAATSRTAKPKDATKPRRTAAKKAPAKRVVKRAPKKTAEELEEEIFEAIEEMTPVRKAPTPIAETNASLAKSRRTLFIGVGVFAVLFMISAVVGLSDAGVVNVQSRFDERMVNASPEERAHLEEQQRAAAAARVPDGGLVPSGVPVEPVVPVMATTTDDLLASSTDAIASSTDALSTTTLDTLVPEPAVAGASSTEVVE